MRRAGASTSSSGEISPFLSRVTASTAGIRQSSSLIRMLLSDTNTAPRRGMPVRSARAPRTHPELRRLAANPNDEAPQLRMLAQPLDRVVLPLQFLLGQCCVDRGMADPVQGYGVPTVAAARYQMVLIDTAAAHQLASAQRTVAKLGHRGSVPGRVSLGKPENVGRFLAEVPFPPEAPRHRHDVRRRGTDHVDLATVQ